MSQVRAVHTFTAEHGDELDFAAGELIDVIERDEGFGDGWWRGRNARGEEGLFPATYIEELSLEKKETEPSPKASPIPTPLEETKPLNDKAEPREKTPEPESMDQTIASVQTAIETMGQPSQEEELGVGQDMRARLAAQAKLANDNREKQRASGGVTGLIYSDESDDEEEPKREENGSITRSHSSSAPSSRAVANELQPPLSLPGTPVNQGNPKSWSVEDVVKWAKSKGFDEGICAKLEEHEISGDLLLELDANLLKELDIPQFGKRLKLAQAINELRQPVASPLQRGMSAPPTALVAQTPAGLSPRISEFSENQDDAWKDTRRTTSGSGNMAPPATTMGTIPERTISVPSSPMTPASSATKRESTGSSSHKKKSSIDGKDRLSFFSRNRKPAPTASPGDTRARLGATTLTHQIQPVTPTFNRAASGGAKALQQIGTPDHSGYMRKKGERYGSWKMRFFVLKGSHLYYMKSADEDRVKGNIDLRGYRVIMDENAHPGSYAFKLVGNDKPHAFSSSEQSTVREWMKALIKATIARDYTVPVTSSCNIPTIPLAEAQAMSPRPPSPATREATQRATRRENTNQLTAHDASVLMSLDAGKRVSLPSRPSRELRSPSNNNLDPGRSDELVKFVNDHLPSQYPRASTIPDSFVSGEVVFLLVRHLSGIEPNPPVPPNAFAPEDGQPSISGLFAMMDILIDAGVDTAGVSINDVRNGDSEAIARLVESVREWSRTRSGP
ncbi:hypothetical protein BD324DRAFT_620926 [Kockovaella imperatae]|uniref:Uncharacterized protein n=1 Tax=Kockovaella imperatae TaxID=4999 RepID=A0A1Y1ULP0_9TREE|nr:hypothetical protein BD324DRAFT_620926 [Kockovaella imperatae]ORX38457.1 hypothetical protein BD324DRAFT_620926 [Kockovaella imperatae]